ncbi:MAG: anhydro-N-acetylmuramic acid kinase [Cocleimonas sp.]
MSKPNNYIGLMSGTSLDGIDTVLVDFNYSPPRLIDSYSHPIPSSLREKILGIINPKWRGSLASIGILHHQLGKLYADACNQLIQKESHVKESIVAIGSHGQTVWHQPEGNHPFSLQLGDANVISELTGITTIADFRNRDIAAGGQGAPLVPAFHQEMLTHPNQDRVILNIGGIANITILSPNAITVGFDTGPGNGLLDAWTQQNKNKAFDENGNWARSGKVQIDILEQLLQNPYFSTQPPKSTGKELFNLAWLNQSIENNLDAYKAEDIQATLTEITALSISDNIKQYSELYVCGGGLRNKFLMERISHHLPETSISSTKTLGIDPDWMEAIAFAWLAKRTFEGKTGNLSTATGAEHNRILGGIFTA